MHCIMKYHDAIGLFSHLDTVYPQIMNLACSLQMVVFKLLIDFTHNLQGCLDGIGEAILLLQWSK